MRNPPLSLYVHIPWCVQKCPYCDFNSHGQKHALPEQAYIAHLLDDLAQDAAWVGERPVHSVFFGGGTPSLFSAEGIARILDGIRQRVNLTTDAEITLEANPGTVEQAKFSGFKDAGVNRISIGVQSFQEEKLKALGRIHDAGQAQQAARYAQQIGLRSFNLDLMHGLPQQSLEDALYDLRQAIALSPPHLSWYQLTIEPNTLFASRPPVLPEDDLLWEIQERGHALLADAGYVQYETSAYSRPGQQCQHNLNYWRFGDYLGIGCGAHGKITDAARGTIVRTVKVKHPKGYMDLSKDYRQDMHQVARDDLPFEFFMNRLRLLEPCPKADYEALTGLTLDAFGVAHKLQQALSQGLLTDSGTAWQVTEQGKRYLNSLLTLLL